MRFFAFIPAVAVLVTAVAGVSLPRQDDCGFEVGCAVSQTMTKREFPIEHAARDAQGWTNAELLRRGLPLKGPIMRRGLGTPVRRTTPSASPNTKKYRGGILVIRATDGKPLGYVSAVLLNGQQSKYGPAAEALIVDFETDSSGSGTQLNLTPENLSAPGFLEGLVEGRDNSDSILAKGSFQYLYLAGTKKTAPGAPPAIVGNTYNPTRTSESAVWTFDHKTGALLPIWVNPPKCATVKLEYFVQGTALYVGGDSAAFLAAYPAPITPVVFQFVQI